MQDVNPRKVFLPYLEFWRPYSKGSRTSEFLGVSFKQTSEHFEGHKWSKESVRVYLIPYWDKQTGECWEECSHSRWCLPIKMYLPCFAVCCTAGVLSFGPLLLVVIWGLAGLVADFFTCFVFQGTEAIYQLRKFANLSSCRFWSLSCISLVWKFLRSIT